MNPNQVFLAHNTATIEFTRALMKLGESGQCRDLLPGLLLLCADVASLDSAPYRGFSPIQFVGVADRCREAIDNATGRLAGTITAPFVRGEWELAEAVYHLRRAQAALILAAHATHRSGGATREPRNSGTIPTQEEKDSVRNPSSDSGQRPV